MAFEQLQTLILATNNNKLLSPLCGQELIVYPIKLLAQLHIPTTLVLESDTQELRSLLTHHVGDTITYATPATHHDSLYQEHVLVMHGVLPLLTPEIIQELYLQHLQTEAAITHAHYADIYIAQRTLLELYALQETTTATYSCSSVVTYAQNHGHKVTLVNISGNHLLTANTFTELAYTATIKRTEIINHWMDNGVYVACTQTIHVDVTATIGSGTTLGAGVHIKGNTNIGSNCTIKEFSIIENSIIGDNVQILPHSVISNAHLDSHVQIGPFAHIKEQSYIKEHAIIGNFVEVKKTTIGSHTKAKHLSYLGNADIGAQVNIGAGTITCNHNGVTKQKTTIEDNAYIGANNTLIAPVTIGESAFTAAGSVITHDVPDHALALGRARQVIKEGYAKKLRNAEKPIAPEQSAFKAAIKTDNTTPSSENT